MILSTWVNGPFFMITVHVCLLMSTNSLGRMLDLLNEHNYAHIGADWGGEGFHAGESRDSVQPLLLFKNTHL